MLIDLSLQGCRITGAPPFRLWTRLRLQLWLPDQSEPVQIEQAIVRWVKDEQVGVSFPKLSRNARARLERVFQVLHEAQQPQARVISIPAYSGSGGGEHAVVPPQDVRESDPITPERCDPEVVSRRAPCTDDETHCDPGTKL